MMSMIRRGDERGLDERAARRGAKYHSPPTRRRLPRDSVLSERSRAREVVGASNDRASTRRRTDSRRPRRRDDRPSIGSSCRARAGASSDSPSVVRWPSGDLHRIGPSRTRQHGAGRGIDHLSRLADQPLASSTEPSHGTNAARTGRFVASGVSGDPINTYFGPATTHGSRPTTASVSAAAPACATRS